MEGEAADLFREVDRGRGTVGLSGRRRIHSVSVPLKADDVYRADTYAACKAGIRPVRSCVGVTPAGMLHKKRIPTACGTDLDCMTSIGRP